MCLEKDHRLPTEQRFAPPTVEEAGNTPVLETVNNTTENPDTALDLNLRPIHFQRGALGGSAESLDKSTDPGPGRGRGGHGGQTTPPASRKS